MAISCSSNYSSFWKVRELSLMTLTATSSAKLGNEVTFVLVDPAIDCGKISFPEYSLHIIDIFFDPFVAVGKFRVVLQRFNAFGCLHFLKFY